MWDFDIRIIFSIYDRALPKFDVNSRAVAGLVCLKKDIFIVKFPACYHLVACRDLIFLPLC